MIYIYNDLWHNTLILKCGDVVGKINGCVVVRYLLHLDLNTLKELSIPNIITHDPIN